MVGLYLLLPLPPLFHRFRDLPAALFAIIPPFTRSAVSPHFVLLSSSFHFRPYFTPVALCRPQKAVADAGHEERVRVVRHELPVPRSHWNSLRSSLGFSRVTLRVSAGTGDLRGTTFPFSPTACYRHGKSARVPAPPCISVSCCAKLRSRGDLCAFPRVERAFQRKDADERSKWRLFDKEG